jgi:hypothetical protein
MRENGLHDAIVEYVEIDDEIARHIFQTSRHCVSPRCEEFF